MNGLIKFLHRVVPEPLANAVRPAYHFTLAVVGELIYRFPGRKLTVIGVTGTNGKSTTASMIAKVLEAGGHRVGLITTVNFKIGDREWVNETKMTSFGRFGTYRYLRQMVKTGCTHAVIEVSSHALQQRRVWGVPFQTAVITNLTRDHLDYHRTMAKYQAAKGRLFAALAKGPKPTRAIVNAEDEHAEYFLSFLADEKYLYGCSPEAGEKMPLAHRVLADDIKSTPAGSTFTVRDDEVFRVELPLPGSFNVFNAMAAICAGLAYQVPTEKIQKALKNFPGVPGRMERVEAGQPFALIVDYAHTADAFEKVLSTLRESTKGRLIAVFGATGDRDRGKRPDLGRVAATYADYLVLTEEDPGSEDPARIIEEILPGVRKAGKDKKDYRIELDRRSAIREALKLAGPEDTVVLLAIGHQTHMVRGDQKVPWYEPTVAKEEWRSLSKH